MDYNLDNLFEDCKNNQILNDKNNLNKNEHISDAESVNSFENLINFSDEESVINNIYKISEIESSSLPKEKKITQSEKSIDKFNEFISEFLPNNSTTQKTLNNLPSSNQIHSSFSLTNKQTNLSNSILEQSNSHLNNENTNLNSLPLIKRKNNWETFE